MMPKGKEAGNKTPWCLCIGWFYLFLLAYHEAQARYSIVWTNVFRSQKRECKKKGNQSTKMQAYGLVGFGIIQNGILIYCNILTYCHQFVECKVSCDNPNDPNQPLVLVVQSFKYGGRGVSMWEEIMLASAMACQEQIKTICLGRESALNPHHPTPWSSLIYQPPKRLLQVACLSLRCSCPWSPALLRIFCGRFAMVPFPLWKAGKDELWATLGWSWPADSDRGQIPEVKIQFLS